MLQRYMICIFIYLRNIIQIRGLTLQGEAFFNNLEHIRCIILSMNTDLFLLK